MLGSGTTRYLQTELVLRGARFEKVIVCRWPRHCGFRIGTPAGTVVQDRVHSVLRAQSVLVENQRRRPASVFVIVLVSERVVRVV
jgi:hypothetical protein